MMSLLSPSKLRSRLGSERGLTLPELLVAMGLLVLVAGVALAIVLSTAASSSRFGQNTANQTEVANAISTINRDISSAQTVTYGSGTALTLLSTENNVNYTVKIFGFDPTKANNALPTGYTVNAANLPNFPAIIEQRQKSGESTVTQNVLVPGWSAANQSTSLFTYYDKDDTQMQPQSSGNNTVQYPNRVVRIEFFIATKVSDRTSNIELAGSATVHSTNVEGIAVGAASFFPAVPSAPVLIGALKEGETTAYLNWQPVGGATSYTLYRKENGGQYQVVKIFGDPEGFPNTLADDPVNPTAAQRADAYADVNPGGSVAATLGNTYTYYVVAFGAGGPSRDSNPVPLTVVPPKVTIVNINSKAGLADVAPAVTSGTTANPSNGLSYTVARGLTNQITWAPVNGATGYYVFRDGSATPLSNSPTSGSITSITDTAVTYGEAHSYVVQAYNQGTNCTVPGTYNIAGRCDGTPSDSVRLVSPPTDPSIGVSNAGVRDRDSSPYNTVTLTRASSSEIISGYKLYRSGTAGAAANCDGAVDTGQEIGKTVGNSVNNAVSFGEGDCYRLYAYNDAGFGPRSNDARAYQPPSSFSFQNVNSNAGLDDTANGYRYTVARGNTNQLAWNESYGAEGYDIYRTDGTYVTTVDANTRSWREGASNGDTRGYFLRAFTDFNDPNGPVRLTTDSNRVNLVSPPTAPSISAYANDDSTGSKSLNYVNVNSRGTNTANVTIYRAQVAAANPACATNDALTNNAGSSNGDGNADWGSSTCYVAQSFNDAGSSPLSNQATADQLPGKFGFNRASNDKHYVAGYAEGFSGLDNASDNSRNQSLQYTLGWSQSLGISRYNALIGYSNNNPGSSNRNDWSGNGYGTCNDSDAAIVGNLMSSGSVRNTKCFRGDGSNDASLAYSTPELSPGSFYRGVTIAVGNNGQRRGIGIDFVTTPTVPKFASVYTYKRQVDNAGKNGTPFLAKVANVGVSTSLGGASTIRAFQDWNDNPDSVGYGTSSPTWYSRSASQGSNDYLRVRTAGLAATGPSNYRASGCNQVTDDYCHVFNTDYDSSGNAHTTLDITAKYNPNWKTAAPTRYQFGNFAPAYSNGGAQTNLSSDAYNYSGWSDQIQWYSSNTQTNCYYRACNPNDSDVTAGSASGPWAGYSNNEYVPNGKTNHAYYFMSSAQGTNPNGDTQGNPPSIATRQYATSSSDASTSDGTLPDNNVLVNG